jgi:hypothetical protein
MNQGHPFAFAAGDRPEGARLHRPPTIAALEDARLRLLGSYAALTTHVPADLPKAAQAPVARITAAMALHVRDLDVVLEQLRRDG